MIRAVVFLTVGLLASCVAHAEVIELEGTVKAVDADARTISIERKTAKGTKTIDLEVNKKAGDLSSVKVGDSVSFSYDPALELITTIAGVDEASRSQVNALCSELRELQGVWERTSAKVGGTSVSPETLANQRARLRVAGCTWAFINALGGDEKSDERDVVIDPDTHGFTMWWRDAKFGKLHQAVGVYSLKGDVLQMCFTMNEDGKAERPTSLVSEPGGQHAVSHVYKRVR